MATTDTSVPQVIVNKLTKAQYDAATKSPTEFYAVTDEDIYSDFTGATSSTAGAHGLVPAPAAGDDSKFLKGDGAWGVVSPSNIDFSAFYRTAPDITSSISVPSSVETQIQELTLPAGTWLVLWGIRFSAQTSTVGITYAILKDSSGNLQSCAVNEATDGTHVRQAVSGTYQLTLTSNRTIYTTLTTAAANASVNTNGPTYLRAIRVG